MIADIILKVAAESRDEDHAYRRRPSSAGPERCIRAMVYHARGEEAQPLPGRAVLIFDDSSWHEELTADWIQKTAFHLHSRQLKVSTPVGDGKIDGVVTDLMQVDRVWEHKALNHFSFERIWNGDWPLDYFTQTALYIVGVQKINPEIRQAIFLVKNKNTAQFMEFILDYEKDTDTLTVTEATRSDGEKIEKPDFKIEKVTQAAVEKFDAVDASVGSGALPDRPFEFGTTFPCGYCRYSKTCWSGYEKEFAALTEDAALDQDAEDLLGYYYEKNGQIKAMQNEKEELRERIVGLLGDAGARKGRAGSYLVTLTLQKRKAFSVAESTSQVLKVIKPKVENENVGSK